MYKSGTGSCGQMSKSSPRVAAVGWARAIRGSPGPPGHSAPGNQHLLFHHNTLPTTSPFTFHNLCFSPSSRMQLRQMWSFSKPAPLHMALSKRSKYIVRIREGVHVYFRLFVALLAIQDFRKFVSISSSRFLSYIDFRILNIVLRYWKNLIKKFTYFLILTTRSW